MRQLIILWMIVMLQHSTNAQFSECNGARCPDGSFLLSPISYNTVRSNVFNGTQPSNEGCTNGVSINGQVTIDCGQGTTLIDCDRGFNGDDYSDLSGNFVWNRTNSVAEQVSIVFRFYQQINISRIAMYFWNSPNNSIIIPNVRLYGSNDDSIIPSNEINIVPGSVSRDGDRRRRFNININDNGLQFQYLRVEMSFYDDSEWIFLGEVEFCGNTAPYNITQPPTDNYVQIVSPSATMATLTCSLNVTIPSTVIVTWLHNGSVVMTASSNGNTTTLQIENPQPSDAGVYQCVFNDTAGYVLRRRTNLLIVDVQIIQPPVNFPTVPFNELTISVQLTCSLNINIPSGVTVTWFYRGTAIIQRPPYEIITVDNYTTLVIEHPQQSDAGDYQCIFMGLDLDRRPVISLEIRCVFISAPANGEILSCSSGTVGVGYVRGTCSFTCNTGYVLSGSDTRTCQSNGSWSGTDIVCSRVRCPSLTNPGNRITNCSLGDDGILSYEDICSFTCNTGYELTGIDTRTCLSNGRWSGTNDVCKRVSCSLLANPSDGVVNCLLGDDGVLSYEDICSFTCNTGYELTGSDTRTCLSNRRWSGSSVVCRRVSCSLLSNPSNGVVNCLLGDDGILSYEDTCSFTCNTGYEPVGSTERTCQSDGSWSGLPVSCTIMECPLSSLPMNSMLAESCSSTYQSMCELQCQEGFTGNGDSSYVCDVLSNGLSVMWMANGNVWKCEKASNNTGHSSDGSAVIGGAIAGIVLLLMVVIVLLCIVILCMRRCNRKGKSHVDGKVFNDTTKLNTNVSVENKPTSDANTAHHFYEIIEPPNLHVSITANPSYSVHTKPHSEGRGDEYNYVQPNEFNKHLDLKGTIKMDTNPSYVVNSAQPSNKARYNIANQHEIDYENTHHSTS